MSKICYNCFDSIDDTATACPSCGAQQEQVGAPAAQMQQMQQPQSPYNPQGYPQGYQPPMQPQMQYNPQGYPQQPYPQQPQMQQPYPQQPMQQPQQQYPQSGLNTPTQGFTPMTTNTTPGMLQPWMKAIAYFPICFFVPLVAAKDDPMSKWYSNQGLLLLAVSLISSIGVTIIQVIFGMMPYQISWIFDIASTIIGLAGSILSLGVFVCTIVGIVQSFQGRDFQIPLIGNITLIK